ncbi:MAG: PolC-type DNA polymerase III, partial [Aggregatilineales bacterium]
MRGDLVALDLETTGLSIEEDSIIEIGAVQFRDGKVIAEYETLIDPGFVIPAETTRITGIYQKDLANQPALAEVLPDIIQFAGNAPIIAHNVMFDIRFMQRFGALDDNLPLDTYELAALLMPSAKQYNLGGLTASLNIELENAHRALDDARATALLYWHLW